MKINDPNLSPLGSTGATRARDAERVAPKDRAGADAAAGPGTGDDVHLSELVRSLRALAADSPERQALLEQLARTYAQGAYTADPDKTAAGIIDHAVSS